MSSVGWQSIFWINIPVGLTAIVLTLRYIPESTAAVARRVDVPGQVFVITLLASLTYGIIEAPAKGWSSPLRRVKLVVATAKGAALAKRAEEILDRPPAGWWTSPPTTLRPWCRF